MKKMFLCLAVAFILSSLQEVQAYQYIYGVDVSKWQGTINWSAVKNTDHKDFAFVKATEGVDYVDPTFTTNINGALNAGMYVGAYHYATPYTNGAYDAISEANDFADAVLPYVKKDKFIRPVLDLEGCSTSLSVSTLSNWTNAFMNQVKARTGLSPILYVSSSYASSRLNSSVTQWDLWVANWTFNPYGTPPSLGNWSNWQFWQYSDKMSITGISGNVDGDAFHGTLADLAQYAVPEPMTLALLAMGGLGLLRRKW